MNEAIKCYGFDNERTQRFLAMDSHAPLQLINKSEIVMVGTDLLGITTVIELARKNPWPCIVQEMGHSVPLIYVVNGAQELRIIQGHIDNGEHLFLLQKVPLEGTAPITQIELSESEKEILDLVRQILRGDFYPH